MVSYPIIYPQNTVLFQTDDPYVEEVTLNRLNGLFNHFLDAIDGSYCSYTTGDTNGIDPNYPDLAGLTAAGYGPGVAYLGPRQCGVYQPTNVISISYLVAEEGLPASYLQRQCNEFMKLGLAGVTVLAASGDSGTSSFGGRCMGPYNTVFSPLSLSTCPYITSVGATHLPYGSDPTGHNEVAAYDTITSGDGSTGVFTSGGGFSNVFPTAFYQQSAVDAYFAKASTLPASYTYNRGGRAYPDISAIGQTIPIYYQGQRVYQDGTSASAPIVAAMITRVNEARLAIGKSPVGFINPILVSHSLERARCLEALF